MADLLLPSLYVDQFRGFKDLTIERLGRVNLIVGKNNVGKTSLLEAIQLYCKKGTPEVLWELLEQRGELREVIYSEHGYEHRVLEPQGNRVDAIKRLFPMDHELSDDRPVMQVGLATRAEARLSLTLHNAEPQAHLHRFDRVESDLEVKQGEDHLAHYPVDLYPSDVNYRPADPVNVVYVPAHGLKSAELGSLWDAISLTDQEDDVLSALQIIAPSIERLTFIGEPKRSSPRTAVVRLQGAKRPVPLSSLGEGMNRMLGLALAMVNISDGVFLIDEIESGLHYSVQLDMWRLIFKLAARLNVQVFATTHSWDCIKAFQRAAKEDEQQEGMLIRLTQKQGRIISTLFSEAELTVITRKNIEVR